MEDKIKNPNYIPAARKARELLSQAWQVLYGEEKRQRELGDIEKWGAFSIMASQVNAIECNLHKYENEFIKVAE